MATSDLLITEYIEGSSNNKAIEIYNGTGADIDLAAAGYVLQMYFNGSSSAGLTINLTGTLARGAVYVVANSAADPAILAQADLTNGAGWFNGDDAVVLRKGGAAGAVVDSLGQVGFDPGTEWGTGLQSTQDNTLRRQGSVNSGDTVTGDAFDPSVGWDGYATNTFDDLGRYTPYSDLIISEYIEGSSNNKALEFYNGTFADIDLAAAGYVIEMYFNGSATAGLTIPLTGTVAAGGVFVLAHSSAAAEILAQADQTNGAGWFNGDDAIVLRKGATVIDSIGQVGVDPGSEWGTGLASTQDNTLRRQDSVTAGDSNPFDAYDPAIGWDGLAQNTFDNLGRYGTPPPVPTLSIEAVDAAAAETGADPGTFRITRGGDLSTAIDVAYTIGGSADADDHAPLSGSVHLAAGSASADITLTPVDDALTEGDETVTLTLQPLAGYQLGSDSATVTIADNDLAATPIHLIQGSGGSSPLLGQTVRVDAIVVGDFQGADGLQGFYLQEEDADADADAGTSEGLFVFQGNGGTAVQVGDHVRVTGRVTEFGTAGATLTELSSVTEVTVLAQGATLPTATVLEFPLADRAVLESVEGMRVSVPTTLTVTDTFTLGRFGEVLLASDGPGNQPGTDARLDQYTQFNEPGVAGLAEYLALVAGRQLLLDDGNGNQNRDPVLFGRDGNPLTAGNTLRGGDTVSGLTGVIDQRFAEYRLQPTETVDFQATNARTTDAGVDGRIKVASFNVLNFFNGDGSGGGFPTSRGADNATELQRQRDKIVAAITGLDADVVGLIELENDGGSAHPAIAELVAALNAGGGTWAYVDLAGALGSDEITVGFIYDSATVAPQGAYATLFDASLPRPALAQTFVDHATGALFTPVINHFKSKGSPSGATGGDVDIGDGQGAWNAQRVDASRALADWLATDPTGQGDPDVIVLGDLNAYAAEDPIVALRAGADDLAGTADDLIELLGPDTYSYSFDGYWGSLDHALASASVLDQLVDAGKWHINADEPTVLDYNEEFKSAGQVALFYAGDAYRSSDHDPVVVGLNPGLVLHGGNAADRLVGTIGNDVLIGGRARDVLTGGAGRDRFVFESLLDGQDSITDFEPGTDLIVVDGLLASVGYAGDDPAGDGYLVTTWAGSGSRAATKVFFDSNGLAPGGQNLIAILTGVIVTDAALLLDAGA